MISGYGSLLRSKFCSTSSSFCRTKQSQSLRAAAPAVALGWIHHFLRSFASFMSKSSVFGWFLIFGRAHVQDTARFKGVEEAQMDVPESAICHSEPTRAGADLLRALDDIHSVSQVASTIGDATTLRCEEGGRGAWRAMPVRCAGATTRRCSRLPVPGRQSCAESGAFASP